MAVTVKKGVAIGGVHPSPKKPAIRGQTVVTQPVGLAVPANAAFPGFNYFGGPVVKCPLVYSSFWGDQWQDDSGHVERAGHMNQFLTDLLGSGFMNVLTQYGLYGQGLFACSSFVVGFGPSLSDGDIQNTIQACIDFGAIPEPYNPTDQCLIIFLDDNTGVDDPNLGIVMCEPNSDTAFGYHNHFVTRAGNPLYYAVIPALTDACLTESCPVDAGCSLHLAEPQESRLTQVTSHEFAEMVTDPELNAWYDPACGECGDICNGESDTITVGTNVWTVQRQYSKYDDLNSDGAITCVSQAPNPYPKLTPGPAGLSQAAVHRAMRSGPVDRLLPLPPVHFDAKARKLTHDDAHIRDYVGRLFSPLRHEQVIPQFPAFLRQVASTLEKGGK